ncbi:hypothetical protein [Trueperella pyogenes]|uniref:hypothetical protein n=1 Tax=Trueperella pyogenes TaxID=1661 RepID=UPI00312B7B6F
MNEYQKDREALIAALNETGFIVDQTQPEIIDRGTILLDSVSYEWGTTFAQVKATYIMHVILDAFDAASAIDAQSAAVAAIWHILTQTAAADIETAGPVFNFSDATGNIYPAFTLTITSDISYT